jgi:hypothetical protein
MPDRPIQLTVLAVLTGSNRPPNRSRRSTSSRCDPVALAILPEPHADPYQNEAVRHIETTLARSLFNCDES